MSFKSKAILAVIVWVFSLCMTCFCFTYSHEYSKAHPIEFTVVDVAKTSPSYFENEITWVRLKFKNGTTTDLQIVNPLNAKMYVYGMTGVLNNPSNIEYRLAKISTPWYHNGFLVTVLIFIDIFIPLILAACIWNRLE